jgi:hypothetical protein
MLLTLSPCALGLSISMLKPVWLAFEMPPKPWILPEEIEPLI